MSEIQAAGQTPFDGIRHVDDQGEYWTARELMIALGYTGKGNWQNFERAIRDAQSACLSQGYNVAEVFSPITKNPSKAGGRPGADYRLTRFACYMIALSAEGSIEQVAAAKVYFAVKTQEREQLGKEMLLALAREVEDNPLAEVAKRIALRQELTDANKELIRRAEQAGVITPKQRAIFMNWGYQGLYAGEVKDEVQDRKELPSGQAISNWMGAVETMANVLRALITRGRMDRQGVDNPTDANYTHYLSGKRIREFLVSEGIYPEQLPTPTRSYRQLVKDEAARIAEEERLEALAEEDRHGLWGQLSQEWE